MNRSMDAPEKLRNIGVLARNFFKHGKKTIQWNVRFVRHLEKVNEEVLNGELW